MVKKQLIVIKFGTAAITKADGEPDKRIIQRIAKEVSRLREKHKVIIVSSGTVGAGKHYIENYKGLLKQRKAAAAVGNPLLITLYSNAFAKYNIRVAQSLCERGHFSNRDQFVQLKETYHELWKNDIVPIANENDVVSNHALKFSDNDELATLIAAGFSAKALLICTKSGGLLDEDGDIIPRVKQIDRDVMDLVDDSLSTTGLGGMTSKLNYTKIAAKLGVKVVIFGMSEKGGLLSALKGSSGTTFFPKKMKSTSKKRWQATSSISTARVIIDKGAAIAIKDRNSLLAVGVKTIKGKFQEGDIIDIIGPGNSSLGTAKAKISSKDFVRHENVIVAHADDILLL